MAFVLVSKKSLQGLIKIVVSAWAWDWPSDICLATHADDPLHPLHGHLSMAVVTHKTRKVDNNLMTSFELESSDVLSHMRR